MSEPALVDADAVFTDEDDELQAELAAMTTDDIQRRTRLIENELRVLKDDEQRLRAICDDIMSPSKKPGS